MNFFCHSLIATALVLFVINFGEVDRVINCSYSDDGRPTPSNYQRSKRLYAGDEVKEGQFPYVVFLKTIRSNYDKTCKERLCTGTLVHERFVLTTSYCVMKQNGNKVKVLIFTDTRPYNEIKENMEYLTSESITLEGLETNLMGNVALIKMNDTFPNVIEFPEIQDIKFNPLNQLKDCITVGFGLIGRNFSTTLSPTGQVRPMMYLLKTTMNFSECIINPKFDQTSHTYDHNQTYLCDLTSPVNASTLCEDGDEGSPLLCTNETEKNPSAGKEMNYKLYGLADIVPNKENCDKDSKNKQTVLFVNLLRSNLWIIDEINQFNQMKEVKYDYDDDMTTKIKNTKTPTPSYTITSRSTTQLSDYYDTDDYELIQKKPIPRCEGGGHVNQDIRDSSFVVHNRVLVEDVPSSVAANTDLTQCACVASVAVAYWVYYYFHHYNNLLVPLLSRRYV